MKAYDFMCCNTKIGVFYVDEDCIGREYKIELIPKYLEIPTFLYLRMLHNGDFVIEDDMVRHFIKGRVMPRTRHNAEDILRRMGLSEYDPYLIAKQCRLSTTDDNYWVDFFGERMEDFHIKADDYLRNPHPLIAENERK